MPQVIENVESVCSECFKEEGINKIPAQIVEEDDKIWIEKKCPKHGSFKSIVLRIQNSTKNGEIRSSRELAIH